ncbi:MAG TPA: hypothetical protein VK694_08125 [Verrucomicrobiae bacterium]|nr:hypothetical protein [Verrucomicrobiae bacterium]
MEWMNRAAPRAAQPASTPAAPAGSAPTAHHGGGGKKKRSESFSVGRIGITVLLFSVTILIIAVTGLIAFSKLRPESRYVHKDRLQAVFLTGGQVYFGKIRALNSSYVGMTDIYYLRVNQQVQPNQQNANSNQQQDISLVKLGCELHGPQDQMLINRDQVIFWENLKDDGQVAKAVAEYVKQNPDGQKCDAKTQDTSTSTPTTNTTPNTTKKP